MVGAQAAVFFDTAPELGEHHHRDVVFAPEPLHVFHERAPRPPCTSAAGGEVGLPDVGVEGIAGKLT